MRRHAKSNRLYAAKALCCKGSMLVCSKGCIVHLALHAMIQIIVCKRVCTASAPSARRVSPFVHPQRRLVMGVMPHMLVDACSTSMCESWKLVNTTCASALPCVCLLSPQKSGTSPEKSTTYHIPQNTDQSKKHKKHKKH